MPIQNIEVEEMSMLKRMCEHIRRDKSRNEDIENKVGVATVVDKMREERLKWFRHV